MGAIGFVVDAGLLEAVLWAGFEHPLMGRCLSFAGAVVVTFEINRRWSFRGVQRKPFWPTFTNYLAVQGFGFFCNFSIYAALLEFLPAPLNRPILCLIAASACALTFNFLGSRHLVFRAGPRSTGL